MAAVVSREWLMEGASLTTSGNTVLEAVETYLVTGCNPNYGYVGMMLDAISATGLPVLWTAHPLISTLNAIQYIPEAASPTDCKVKVRFVNTSPQIILRGGCALQQIQTDMDYDGNPIIVSNYNATASPPITTATTGLVLQSGVVSALKSQAVFSVARVRPNAPFSGNINPILQQRDLHGRVNSDTVTISGVSFAPGTLLCENVGFDSDGLWGVAWNMSYEMRYDADGFNPEVVFIDRETGEPAVGLTKDPFFNNANPLDRIGDSSWNFAGRKVIKVQGTAALSPLFA